MHDPITLPTTPGAIIGYRKSGAPIRLIAGGSGDSGTSGGAGDSGTSGGTGDGAPASQAPQSTDTGADTGQTGPQNTAQDGQSTGDRDISSLPEWAQKMIRDARAEAAKSRTNAKQAAAEQARQDLAQQIGRALGLIKDGDDAPDPAALAEQLASAQAEGRQARVELAVYKAAAKADADPVALLDSRSFIDSLKDVDPSDDDAVAKAIRQAVEKNPRLRAAPAAPPASGAPMGGQPPASKPKTLEAAIAAHYRKR